MDRYVTKDADRASDFDIAIESLRGRIDELEKSISVLRDRVSVALLPPVNTSVPNGPEADKLTVSSAPVIDMIRECTVRLIELQNRVDDIMHRCVL